MKYRSDTTARVGVRTAVTVAVTEEAELPFVGVVLAVLVGEGREVEVTVGVFAGCFTASGFAPVMSCIYAVTIKKRLAAGYK